MPSKAGDHFIQYEHDSVPATERLHVLQEISLAALPAPRANFLAATVPRLPEQRRTLGRSRLQNHAGDLAWILRHQCFERGHVVVLEQLSLLLNIGRYAGCQNGRAYEPI